MNFMKAQVSPLHDAAFKNSKECLVLLLSRGAEVNAQNSVRNDYNMN